MGWHWPDHDRNVGKAGVRRNWNARDHNTRQSGGMRGGGKPPKGGCPMFAPLALLLLPVVLFRHRRELRQLWRDTR